MIVQGLSEHAPHLIGQDWVHHLNREFARNIGQAVGQSPQVVPLRHLGTQNFALGSETQNLVWLMCRGAEAQKPKIDYESHLAGQ